MRIGIMGSGAVGSYYGAKLAQAGHELFFIARGTHLAGLQQSGLRVVGQEEFHLPVVHATSDPSTVGPVDVILFTVKAYDTAASAQLIRPLVGPSTMVLPLQNGVSSYETIGDVVGREHMVGGVCFISAALDGPGQVKLLSPFKEIVFGEMDGQISDRTRAFSEVLERAGIPNRVSHDIRVDLWEKFVFINGLSGMTGATRLPLGPIRDLPEGFALYRRVIEEVVAVGVANGVPLSTATVDQVMERVRQLAPGLKASLLVDLERGKQTEVETLQGTVVRLGKETGVPTPVTEVLYGLIKLHQPR